MKPTVYLLLLYILCAACQNQEAGSVSEAELPRIAIAGIGIESSTFSPATTNEEAFHAKTGSDIFEMYPFLAEDSSLREQAEWIPTLRGHALPGGIVTREAYESLVGKTIEMLEANGPYDGIFFDIHGAMSVEGLEDPEGDMISRIRSAVGYEPIISTSMDLHGNVSRRLAEESDIITCYRMAPHEDAVESDRRAVSNLLDRIDKGRPAYKAWIPVPILLPGEKTSTRIDPGKSLYAKVGPVANQEGIVDAAIWIGYAWADEPRNQAAVVVTGDNREKVIEGAEYLARSFWDVRHEFEFVAPTATLEESLEKALKSDKKPFIISDMGDNPTAGGAGDVTWTLHQLLKRPEFQTEDGPTVIYASIPGPDLVKKAVEAGTGAKITGEAGAMIDDRYAGPVELTGVVESIHEGDIHAETEVVIRTGSLHVIVTAKRKPYHHVSDFTNLGLDPHNADIVIVKIGYLVPELYDMRGDWIMALTPGGVDQDLERLPYKNIHRPMYPLDPDMEDPDLSAILLESNN